MERPHKKLQIGDWCVDPTLGQISRNGEVMRLEVRTMRLLLCLADHDGEVVSIDDLLNQVWSGVIVSQDSVYQAVTSLRRVLGDDPRQPTYIATVPRLGYRMVAAVSPWDDALSTNRSQQDQNIRPAGPPADRDRGDRGLHFRGGFTLAGVVLLLGLMVFALFAHRSHGKVATGNSSSPPAASQTQKPKSIAVLPFLDLTEAMTEEPFADGMTEELIDKLSKVHGLRVPPPTSSFYFKGTKIPLADIARTLGVAYLLDGSVRKSGARLRVAARLVRADNGYIVWSETYDRPFDDILMVQDDIAGEVTKALRASIEVDGDTPR